MVSLHTCPEYEHICHDDRECQAQDDSFSCILGGLKLRAVHFGVDLPQLRRNPLGSLLNAFRNCESSQKPKSEGDDDPASRVVCREEDKKSDQGGATNSAVL